MTCARREVCFARSGYFHSTLWWPPLAARQGHFKNSLKKKNCLLLSSVYGHDLSHHELVLLYVIFSLFYNVHGQITRKAPQLRIGVRGSLPFSSDFSFCSFCHHFHFSCFALFHFFDFFDFLNFFFVFFIFSVFPFFQFFHFFTFSIFSVLRFISFSFLFFFSCFLIFLLSGHS